MRYRRSITQPLAGSKSENEIFVVFLIIGLRRHNCACRKSYQNGSIKSHVVCRGNLRFMRSVSVIQFAIVITWLLVTEAKGRVKKVKKFYLNFRFSITRLYAQCSCYNLFKRNRQLRSSNVVVAVVLLVESYSSQYWM